MIPKTLEEHISPASTAVLVIDVQNDFCSPEGSLAVEHNLDRTAVPAIISRINRLVEEARRAGGLVIFVRECVNAAYATATQWALCEREGDFSVAKEGTWGAEFCSDLAPPLPNEQVIIKRNYDAFQDTPLELLLRSNGIQTLIFTGFATNVCVETTARHAYILGYYVVVVEDCTGADFPGEHEAALNNIRGYFGKVATAHEIEQIWDDQPRE